MIKCDSIIVIGLECGFYEAFPGQSGALAIMLLLTEFTIELVLK